MASTEKSSNLSAVSSSRAGVVELLPDPMRPRADPPTGSADELIAEIAEQQIDALIGELDHEADSESLTNASAAAELAMHATEELQKVATDLSDQASADLIADLVDVAKVAEQIQPTSPPALAPVETFVSEATAPAAGAVVPSDAGSTAPSVTPTEPLPHIDTSAPVVDHPIESSPIAAMEPVVASDSPPGGMSTSIAPPEMEINQAEIDALISNGAAGPVPPTSTVAAHEPLPRAQRAVDIARSLESDAEEVARELAQEAVSVAAHLPSINPAALRPGRVREAIASFLMGVLGIINFPVRNLSDNAREIIGIVAIVTLVNAMSLLLYLMIFG